MLVRGIRSENEEEEDEEEDEGLMSSMKSEYSIKEANMTLRPGNNTFPTVSPRDKRRIKDDVCEYTLLILQFLCLLPLKLLPQTWFCMF